MPFGGGQQPHVGQAVHGQHQAMGGEQGQVGTQHSMQAGVKGQQMGFLGNQQDIVDNQQGFLGQPQVVMTQQGVRGEVGHGGMEWTSHSQNLTHSLQPGTRLDSFVGGR